MAGGLTGILERFRAESRSEREKGDYFEKIVLAYFRNDPLQKELYEHAWTFADWAHSNGLDGRDACPDLVAKIKCEPAHNSVIERPEVVKDNTIHRKRSFRNGSSWWKISRYR